MFDFRLFALDQLVAFSKTRTNSTIEQQKKGCTKSDRLLLAKVEWKNQIFQQKKLIIQFSIFDAKSS